MAKSERAVISYLRVSTEDQATTGVSLAAQDAAIRAYCEMRSLTLVEVVVDAGVSAAKPLSKREGGQRVLERVRSGEVSAVVAYKLDRVFRDCADCLAVVRDWEQRDVALHLVDLGGQTIDTTTAMGRFFLTVMAGAAELERNLIGERTKSALTHVKKVGGRLGRPALGWRRDSHVDASGRLVVSEVGSEMTTIARMIELRADGYSLPAIAKALSKEGHATKRGGRWTPETVRRVLRRSTLTCT